MANLFNYEKVKGELHLCIPIQEYDEMKAKFDELEAENWELRTKQHLMGAKLEELGFSVVKTYLGNEGYSIKPSGEQEKGEDSHADVTTKEQILNSK